MRNSYQKLPLLIAMVISVLGSLNAQDSPGKYTVKNVKINTDYSDFGTAFYGEDKVVFAAPKQGFTMNREEYNSQPFLDLYIGTVTEDGQLIHKQKLPGDINSKFHEGMVTFSKDMKTVYFSANGKIKKKKNKVKTKVTVNIHLFKATINDLGEWTNLELLPFNSDEFSTGHPVLNGDDTQLYFISDRPESIGKTDIYVVDILEDGTYSEPRNLGPDINTPEREMFPFVSKDNVLYFSSDGYPGFGELDIYAAKIYDNTIAAPMNLGEPINSPLDDFAYIINESKQKGYFSSNRAGGKGDDDIYTFEADPPIYFECEQEIVGVVRNVHTQELIPNAMIKLFDSFGNELESVISDPYDASFGFDLSCGTELTVKGYLEGYLIGEMDIKVKNDLGAEPLEITLLMERDPSVNIDAIASNADAPTGMNEVSDDISIDEKKITKEATVATSAVAVTNTTKAEESTAADTSIDEGELSAAVISAEVASSESAIVADDQATTEEVAVVEPVEEISEVNAEQVAQNTEIIEPVTGSAQSLEEAEGSEPVVVAADPKESREEVSPVSSDDDQEVANQEPKSTQETGFSINTIYFDFDKYLIRYDARRELDKLASYLQTNPQINIKVNSHADIRGRKTYNDTLSNRRADKTIQYLIGKGVEPERLKGEGFGENQPAVYCEHSKPCTSFQHQLNRRSEFELFDTEKNTTIAHSINRTDGDFVLAMSDGAYANYHFDSETEAWTVQIGAFYNQADLTKFRKLKGVFNHKYTDGYQRYFSGVFETTTEAKTYMRWMRQNGFEGAFVVGLKGEERFFKKPK